MFFDLKLSGRSDCSESVCSAVMLGRLLFCIQLRARRKAAPFDPDCGSGSETLVPTQVNDHAPGPCSLYPYKLDW